MWFVRRISGFPSHGRVRDGHDLHGFMHCICQQSSFFGGDKELWTQNLFIYFCNFFDVIHSCDECKSYNGRSFKHIQPILRSTKVIEGLEDNLCMYAYGADKNRRGCWVKQIVRTKIFNLTIEKFYFTGLPSLPGANPNHPCGSSSLQIRLSKTVCFSLGLWNLD